MAQITRKQIGRILKDRGVVQEGQIQAALHHQRQHGGLLGQILVDMGFANAGDIAAALAVQSGMEVLEASALVPQEAALKAVDASTAIAMEVLPLRLTPEALTVAIADPLNAGVAQDLQFLVGRAVKVALGDAATVRALLRKHYGDGSGGLQAALDAAKDAGKGKKGEEKDLAQSAPVVRLLNSILFQAIRDKASDIHFEPFEGELRIRFRVDGSLYQIQAPPSHLSTSLIARVKVMANLDIAETRVPQDGRIELSIDGRPVDLRVATLPTMYGESVVMRILDRTVVQLDLRMLGLANDEEAELRRLMALPHGIVLVTGPTGSGKTTTLYALLSEANDPAVKIITTEDPVEYDIDGIVQIPIQEDIGVTYSRVLRTILRQDPDKILVGEIRDPETAQVAVEASLTGHVVFSTLHTNDAPSAITRLVDIGVAPYLIASTLDTVVAQRLVRKICPDCKVAYQPDEAILRDLGAEPSDLAGARFAYGKGCDRCHHTGYRGRLAIFEILRVSERLREAILTQASAAEIRAISREEGARTLRESGMRRVTEGMTTVEEVLRETLV
ncbi:MAG: Flp pilus assembly complex ATPase component TadA [Planctomycetes bacterium]|nr:Flp pilus assembly complex ATPase component TadA [Planctomycetota bacterium]